MSDTSKPTARVIDDRPADDSVLLIQTESNTCALPLSVVAETMRPLKCDSLANSAAFLLGVSLIRGLATPVVSLPVLLGESGGAPAARWVTVRIGARMAAIAIPRVLGVFNLAGHARQGLPPLLGDAGNGFVADVAALDEQLLLVLRVGRIVPEAVWESMREQGTLT